MVPLSPDSGGNKSGKRKKRESNQRAQFHKAQFNKENSERLYIDPDDLPDQPAPVWGAAPAAAPGVAASFHSMSRQQARSIAPGQTRALVGERDAAGVIQSTGREMIILQAPRDDGRGGAGAHEDVTCVDAYAVADTHKDAATLRKHIFKVPYMLLEMSGNDVKAAGYVSWRDVRLQTIMNGFISNGIGDVVPKDVLSSQKTDDRLWISVALAVAVARARCGQNGLRVDRSAMYAKYTSVKSEAAVEAQTQSTLRFAAKKMDEKQEIEASLREGLAAAHPGWSAEKLDKEARKKRIAADPNNIASAVRNEAIDALLPLASNMAIATASAAAELGHLAHSIEANGPGGPTADPCEHAAACIDALEVLAGPAAELQQLNGQYFNIHGRAGDDLDKVIAQTKVIMATSAAVLVEFNAINSANGPALAAEARVAVKTIQTAHAVLLLARADSEAAARASAKAARDERVAWTMAVHALLTPAEAAAIGGSGARDLKHYLKQNAHSFEDEHGAITAAGFARLGKDAVVAVLNKDPSEVGSTINNSPGDTEELAVATQRWIDAVERGESGYNGVPLQHLPPHSATSVVEETPEGQTGRQMSHAEVMAAEKELLIKERARLELEAAASADGASSQDQSGHLRVLILQSGQMCTGCQNIVMPQQCAWASQIPGAESVEVLMLCKTGAGYKLWNVSPAGAQLCDRDESEGAESEEHDDVDQSLGSSDGSDTGDAACTEGCCGGGVVFGARNLTECGPGAPGPGAPGTSRTALSPRNPVPGDAPAHPPFAPVFAAAAAAGAAAKAAAHARAVAAAAAAAAAATVTAEEAAAPPTIHSWIEAVRAVDGCGAPKPFEALVSAALSKWPAWAIVKRETFDDNDSRELLGAYILDNGAGWAQSMAALYRAVDAFWRLTELSGGRAAKALNVNAFAAALTGQRGLAAHSLRAACLLLNAMGTTGEEQESCVLKVGASADDSSGGAGSSIVTQGVQAGNAHGAPGGDEPTQHYDFQCVVDLTDEQTKMLIAFDMDSAFGPCVGLTRKERWIRAEGFGLAPPSEVMALLSLVRDDSAHNVTVVVSKHGAGFF